MPVKRWREFHRTPFDQPMDTIVAYCQEATKSLHGSVYGWTYKPLAQVFVDKHKAGLEVGLVVDKTQAAGTKQKPLLQWMVDEGVPVTIATAPTGQINHEKALLVDVLLGADANESYAVYGSLNYSEGGPKQENHVQCDNDPTIVADLYKQFIEAQAYGMQHPQWQLKPNTAEPPTVPADVAATPDPPESPAPTA